MELRESAEDYLETILLLSQKTGAVRSKDIVDEMGFSKPSISVAMKKLRENALIHMDDEGYITLTREGNQVAERVYERHSVLYGWLVSIGIEDQIASTDACRMEHIISEETFQGIKKVFEESKTL